MSVKNILILSSSTGGGHDMRAAALTEWIRDIRGEEVFVKRWQALEESSALDRFGVNLYNLIQRHTPWTHHLYFNFLELAGLHRRASGIRGAEAFRALLKEFEPDVVLSTHAHLNHGYFQLVKDCLGGSVRCLTYCGELSGGYGFSKHWVNPECHGFIASVEECAEAAKGLGMSEEATFLGGFLLRPQFYGSIGRVEASAQIRNELSIDAELPLVLLGTGANGANNHASILSGLRSLDTPLAVLALCGKNDEARNALEGMNSDSPHRVVPLGYREDMSTLLRAVDVAFVRPGTGTTSECIVSGCPVLFNGIGGVMPQEGITVKFLRGRGLPAEVVRRPGGLAAVLQRWLANRDAGPLAKQRAGFAEINASLHPEQIVGKVLG